MVREGPLESGGSFRVPCAQCEPAENSGWPRWSLQLLEPRAASVGSSFPLGTQAAAWTCTAIQVTWTCGQPGRIEATGGT